MNHVQGQSASIPSREAWRVGLFIVLLGLFLVPISTKMAGYPDACMCNERGDREREEPGS
jgi:hypothetical protein